MKFKIDPAALVPNFSKKNLENSKIKPFDKNFKNLKIIREFLR